VDPVSHPAICGCCAVERGGGSDRKNNVAVTKDVRRGNVRTSPRYARLAHGHALREDRCIASRREIRHDLEQKLAAAERLEAGAERIRDGWAFSG
jgi:hypothetical protein